MRTWNWKPVPELKVGEVFSPTPGSKKPLIATLKKRLEDEQPDRIAKWLVHFEGEPKARIWFFFLSQSAALVAKEGEGTVAPEGQEQEPDSAPTATTDPATKEAPMAKAKDITVKLPGRVWIGYDLEKEFGDSFKEFEVKKRGRGLAAHITGTKTSLKKLRSFLQEKSENRKGLTPEEYENAWAAGVAVERLDEALGA